MLDHFVVLCKTSVLGSFLLLLIAFSDHLLYHIRQLYHKSVSYENEVWVHDWEAMKTKLFVKSTKKLPNTCTLLRVLVCQLTCTQTQRTMSFTIGNF